MTDTGSSGAEQWVVWNGSLGVLDIVTIGHVDTSTEGRTAWLDAPYGVVGPFSLDELERTGRIAFGACFVMSRKRWQEDQVELRSAAQKARRKLMAMFDGEDDSAHREALGLPPDGRLDATEINAAFRRRAKTAHPDAGGSDADYRRIAEARDALLEMLADA